MATPSSIRPTRTLGIDGCRAGWLAVSADLQTRRIRWQLVAAGTLSGALGDEVTRVFIDMPIGLSADGSRMADYHLRRAPGVRSATVFTPPCRAALGAENHAEATRLNRQVCNKGISIQSWNIVPRLREVDALLARRVELRDVVAESHPEWVFAGLAGDDESIPPLPPKKSSQGRAQRLALLQAYVPDAAAWLEDLLRRTRRSEVQADDALDALALAVSAELAHRNGIERFGGDLDDTGLPMQVVRHRVSKAR